MRKLFLFATALLLSTALLAQKGKGNPHKSREDVLGTGTRTEHPQGNKKDKGAKEPGTDQQTRRGNDPIWEGTRDSDGGRPKPSKNQPAKVRAAFDRDYPNATAVSWSKYRGDWTASFTQGLVRSTAVYHANGERRDTRTVIPQSQVPRPVLEGITKKSPGTRIGDIIRIQGPRLLGEVFRIKTTNNGTTNYQFYNADGKQVSYDY